MTNAERAERAEFGLLAYSGQRHVDELPPDVGETLTDFIADAMHLLGREAVLDSVRRAEAHHQAELEEEGGAS